MAREGGRYVRVRRAVALILLIVLLIVIVYPSIAKASLAINISIQDVDVDEGRLTLFIDKIQIHRVGARGEDGWVAVTEEIEPLQQIHGKSQIWSIVGDIPVGKYDSIQFSISNVTITIGSEVERVDLRGDVMRTDLDLYMSFASKREVKLIVEYDQDLLSSNRVFDGRLIVTSIGAG